MKIKLHKDERIIAVVPSFSSGPGWSNMPLWIYIEQCATKSLRKECVQPEEQTAAMHTLFRAGAAMHEALVDTVKVENLSTYSNETSSK